MTALEPPKPKILPPNDPARPEWGIFSDVLGVPCTPDPGSSPQQAAEKLHGLLINKVLSKKATADALIMKCAGKQIAGALKTNPRGYDRIMEFLTQRLWNRRADGVVTPSRVGKKYSSNQVFLAWEPENGGLVKYLSVNAGKILAREFAMAGDTIPGRISLDAIREGSNRELDSSGNLAQRSRPVIADTDEAPDPVENDEVEIGAPEMGADPVSARPAAPEEADELVADRDDPLPSDAEALALRTETEVLPEEAEDAISVDMDPTENVATESRRQFNVCAVGSAMASTGSIVLRTTQHPDYRLLSAALMLADTPAPADCVGERNEQLREMARGALEIHLVDAEARGEFLDSLNNWDPSHASFANTFPKLTRQFSESLDLVSEPKVEDRGHDAQAEFLLDYVNVSEELARQSRRLPPQPKGMTASEWDEVVLCCQTWFKASSSNEQDLLSVERPDYLALCALTGEEPQRSATPEALGRHLKHLYSAWAGATFTHVNESFGSQRQVGGQIENILEMHRRMAGWNPTKDGYAGETMVSHLFDIRSEQQQAQQAAAAAREREKQSYQGRPAPTPRAVPLPSADQQLTLDSTDFVSLDLSSPAPEVGGLNQGMTR